MKQSIIKYVITDPFAKAFWVRTSYYGRAPDTLSIFSIVFTNNLTDANFMSEEKATETLKEFFEFRHVIQDEATKVDTQSLVVSPITITYEQDS